GVRNLGGTYKRREQFEKYARVRQEKIIGERRDDQSVYIPVPHQGAADEAPAGAASESADAGDIAPARGYPPFKQAKRRGRPPGQPASGAAKAKREARLAREAAQATLAEGRDLYDEAEAVGLAGDRREAAEEKKEGYPISDNDLFYGRREEDSALSSRDGRLASSAQRVSNTTQGLQQRQQTQPKQAP